MAPARVSTSRAASRGGRGAVEPVGQAPAADELHLEVGEAGVLVDVEDLDDVGVLELGDGLGLGQEPGGGLGAGVLAGQDHLQGDGAVESDLAGLVDDAHAAAAEFAQDLVARECRVVTQGGSRGCVAIRRHDKVGRRDVAGEIRRGPPGFGLGAAPGEK